MPRPEKIRLGEILVKQRLLTEEQLQQALQEQRTSGRKLGKVFVEEGFVTETQISEALAHQFKIPFIDLKHFNAAPKVVQKLPEAQARRFRAIVLEDRGDSYLVGMADPADLFAYDEIERVLAKDIRLAVVTESAVLQVVDRVYRRSDELSSLAQALGQDIDDAIDFAQLTANANVEDAPVVRLLQTIFEDAVQVRASDIHIEPQELQLQVRFRIDGELTLQMEADSKIANAVILRLKLMSGLDISEKRLPQDGRFAIKVKQQPVDVRISSLPTQYGESVVMRLLIQNASSFSLDNIGMPMDMLELFRKLIHRPSGLVLVTGPTGSGKTTTLYSALSELNTIANKILTVEDPVEYRLPGLNQVQVNDKIELTFAKVLRSTLRQDPDVILVGEMRDQETSQIGLRAAMTGHLVLSTLHTNDAVSAPARLLDMGVPRYMVAMAVLGVIAQRLVRTICRNCITSYTPQPFEREWLKLELGEGVDQQQFAKGEGCTSCNGSGYHGRMAVYEVLEMNNELVEAANHHDTNHFTKLANQHMVGKTLRKNAVDMVLARKTTIAEAMRINNQFDS